MKAKLGMLVHTRTIADSEVTVKTTISLSLGDCYVVNTSDIRLAMAYRIILQKLAGFWK